VIAIAMAFSSSVLLLPDKDKVIVAAQVAE